MKLDLKDRLFLRNQFKILSYLDTNDSEYYIKMVDVLEHGYEAEYGDLIFAFSEGFSQEQCEFVLEVLSMHTSFEWAKQEGIQHEKEQSFLFNFHGFDGNNELHYMLYAEFQIKQEHQWDSLKGKAMNSHSPTLDRYTKMLKLWNESANPHKLTKEDFDRIAAGMLQNPRS